MINKNWLFGFIEGEGCFSIIIKKSANKVGYQVIPDFSIKLTASEVSVLQEIRKYFGNIGNIYFRRIKSMKKHFRNANDEAMFKVVKLKEVKKIVKTLKGVKFVSSGKKHDFYSWCECIDMIDKKVHLTKKGILKIAELRDSIHRRKQWNKKNYCNIRKDIDPCEIYLKTKKIPVKCDKCKTRIKVCI